MKYASFALIALLILAACAAQEPSKAKQIAEELKEQPVVEQTPQAEPQPEKTELEQEQKTEVIEQSEVKTPAKELVEAMEETTSEAQQRTRMYKFLDVFAKDVKSYEFKYKGDSYFAKGTSYKIILKLPGIARDVSFGETKKQYFYYDTVYVNRAAKTAIAYCEGYTSQVNKYCTEFELYDLAYPAQYKNYEITLPEDWLFEYLNKEPDLVESNKYYLEGRGSTFVKFNEDPVIEMSMDPGTGLPLRVDKKKGNQILSRYDYEDLVSNKVRDIDMEHRSKGEIPSSEVFYR